MDPASIAHEIRQVIRGLDDVERAIKGGGKKDLEKTGWQWTPVDYRPGGTLLPAFAGVFAENDQIRADAIAVRQPRALREYESS
jgi:hypothetical protein